VKTITTDEKIESILKKTFKLDSFRSIQKEIITSVIEKNNTLAIMPTGGGKSLTYQLPGVYFEGMTLVISPLISLMQDQVNYLRSKKINAEFYNNSLNEQEKKDVLDKIKDNLIKFLYIAPERLFMNEILEKTENGLVKTNPFIKLLNQYTSISLIVIDEAHCVSSWGYDFREDYLKLDTLRTIFPNVPVLALTASADNIAKNEIQSIFDIKNVFETPIERKNIYYHIEKKMKDGFLQVEKIIKKNKNKSGIVYCFKKDDVDELTKNLKKKGFLVESYHADLKDEKKKKVLKDFIDNKIEIVVATIAFGMGIDKPNIRYVIHKDIPKTIEGYYQETGRAGRDGLLSDVYTLYSKRDSVIMDFILNNSNRKWIEKNKFNLVRKMVETTYCRKSVLNWYFDNHVLYKNENCGQCDVCKNKKLEKYTVPETIDYFNEHLHNNPVGVYEFEKFSDSELKLDKNEFSNILYQLIFSGKIIFDKKENSIMIQDRIDKNILLNRYLDLNLNFEIVEPKKRKTTRTTKTPVKKTTPRKKTVAKKKTEISVAKKKQSWTPKKETAVKKTFSKKPLKKTITKKTTTKTKDKK